jgi:hypothetical protein
MMSLWSINAIPSIANFLKKAEVNKFNIKVTLRTG